MTLKPVLIGGVATALEVGSHNGKGAKLMLEIRVGTLAIARRDSAICSVGELGVCYDVSTLGNRLGYSFIFEEGGYDGFSPEDIELFLEVTDVVFQSIANYGFENVTQLERDYHQGRFSEAFTLQRAKA